MLGAPQIPSASETASVQSGLNKDTAIAQANLNHVNQVTPYGNLTYTQDGTNPDGTPKYTATQTLSPDQQSLLNTNMGTLKNLSGTGGLLAGQIGQNLSQPLDFSQQRDFLNNLTNQNLDYQFGRGQQSLEQSLANKGLNPQSEAYRAAQRDFDTNKAASYNQANLSNYSTALQSQQALRDLPLNELSGLLSQTQVQSPQFAQTPQTGINPTDYSNLVNQQYQAQQNQYNGMWSGLGSLGSTLGGFLLSDERLKEDISETGMFTEDGIPVKEFAYKGSPIMHLGVMAQDTEKVRPDAVATLPSGIKMVNYDKVGSPMLTLGAKRAA